MISYLFSSTIVHERFKPFRNKFRYKALTMFIDYDELNYISKNYLFFSYNKFNIFSFDEKDHGYRDGRLLVDFVKDFLKKNDLIYKKLKIKILCFPRVMGYVFNPLSIIFCFDNDNLVSIFYEVKNTPNEQHTYCFASKGNTDNTIFKHYCSKDFYVSPFIEMNCNYKFTTKIPNEKLSIIIEVFDDFKKRILLASQIGKKINFSSYTLFKNSFNNPLIMFKIISLILYQSLKIIIKGGKYYSRKKKLKDSISFEGYL